MSRSDQNGGFGGRGGERSRQYDPRRPSERDRPWEGRTFGERGQFNSDEARYDEGRGGPRYGQEYGMEGGRAHEMQRDEPRGRGRRGDDERETWRPDAGEPYGDLELNPRNRGVQEFGPPADYAYHPHAGHEFDSDYLRWRESQMREHDRDYLEWRRSRQQQYDDEYRRFRAERRDAPKKR